MQAREFTHLLRQPANLDDLKIRDLQRMLEQWPWCQALNLLYTRKCKLEQGHLSNKELVHASAILPNRMILHEFLNGEPNEIPEPEVSFEYEIPIVREEEAMDFSPGLEDEASSELSDLIPPEDVPAPSELEFIGQSYIPQNKEQDPPENTPEEKDISEEVELISEEKNDIKLVSSPNLDFSDESVNDKPENDVNPEFVKSDLDLSDIDANVLKDEQALSSDNQNIEENELVLNDEPLITEQEEDLNEKTVSALNLLPETIEEKEIELADLAEEEVFSIAENLDDLESIHKPLPEETELIIENKIENTPEEENASEINTDELTETDEKNQSNLNPNAKSTPVNFSNWLQQLNPVTKEQSKELAPSPEALKETKKKEIPLIISEPIEDEEFYDDDDPYSDGELEHEDVNEFASLSLQEDDEYVTETLANILALQGKNKKAIEMYKKLQLEFPEKSDYFADKIAQLQN